MSYCRFSSDNFMCDVYVYEDCAGGWTTHVAGVRNLKPTSDPFTRKYHRWLNKKHKSKPIGLLHDGKQFSDSTPGECADRLCGLREMGYSVPQYAIEALREEDET